MKKTIFTTLTILLSTGLLLAQEISVGKASIAKADRTCVMASYTMPSEIIGDALSDKLNKSKISKGKRVRGGFRVYQGVSIPEISNDKIDLYTKVSGKRDNSTLYLAVSRGYDNFVTPETDAEVMEAMKSYIKGMISNVNIAKIKTDIAAQAKVVNRAEKDQDKLVKTGKSLVSDMKDLESKLAKNKKDQEANQKEQEEAAQKLKAEEAMLSELKSKLQMMLKK